MTKVTIEHNLFLNFRQKQISLKNVLIQKGRYRIFAKIMTYNSNVIVTRLVHVITFNVYSNYRYNGIISRVKKRRIKRSENERIKTRNKKKKDLGRRKRQTTETVSYDLGKRHRIITNALLGNQNYFSCFGILYLIPHHICRVSDTKEVCI